MTTDTRKTLEACAKVMGIQGWFFDIKRGLRVDDEDGSLLRFFNPLTSVADAAEMVIRLKIAVWWNEDGDKLFAQDNDVHQLVVMAATKDHPSEQLAYCYAVCKVAEQLSEVM